MKILWLTLCILLLFVMGCVPSIHDRYYASETVITLTQSGTPVSGATLIRKTCVQGADSITIDEEAVTNNNGKASFTELKRKGYIISIGTHVYTHRYYYKTVDSLQLIKRTGKVGHKQYSDTRRYVTIDSLNDETVLKLSIDLDSLDVTKYDYPPSDPKSHYNERVKSNK